MRDGDFVRITGGVDCKGQIGEVVNTKDDHIFIGVRVPDKKRATETIYVTRGSVEICEKPKSR